MKQADQPVYVEACDCRTPLGSAEETCLRLLDGEIALRATAVDAVHGTPAVPMAAFGDIHATLPPRWLEPCRETVARMPDYPWGAKRYPVIITSSNFGIDHMFALHQGGDGAHARFASPAESLEAIAGAAGIGPNREVISNACVSAQLGLLQGQRLLSAGLADAVLLLSFDFLSPFVAGGFYSLKILNGLFPQPYADRAEGAIGLGEGVAGAVLSHRRSAFRIAASASHAECRHMTGNEPTGSGFRAIARATRESAHGRRLWIKGHGTGTLDSGRMECEQFAVEFRDAPLVSWKGSLGHTLGSCGLVEMAIALSAMETHGRAPGTIGSQPPFFPGNATADPIATRDYDGAALFSSAFGGMHAATVIVHD